MGGVAAGLPRMGALDGDTMSQPPERGPTGDHGQDGRDGADGRTGATGLTGLTGRRGAEGPSVPVREWRRFKKIIYAGMLLLTLSTAFLFWQQQQQTRELCEARNTQQQATGAALAKLVEAHRRDGSTHASKTWQGFLDVAAKHPPPAC